MMKIELSKFTELKDSEINSENPVNSVKNSAPLRLCGSKSE
jgi:hypothetical protein